MLKCRCLADAPGQSATVVEHVRLFRNRPGRRWRYRVHEQILPAVRASGAELRWADVTLDHTGYTDPATQRRKAERNLRLLALEAAEHPGGDPYLLFQRGWTLLELGRPAEALPVLGDSLQRGSADGG